MGGSPSEPPAMFSSTAPPGASVAWPPRDERQGWHMPSTRGRPALGKTSLTKTTEIGTAIRPLRSVTLPARADGSPSAPRLGVRPRVPAPPDPAPSAHPGFSATNLRRGGAGQTARAHCPGVPDHPRRTCGGVPAGSAQIPVARCAPRARRHEGGLDGRQMGRVTGGGGRLTDGGDTTSVINDMLRPRRGHGEHRLALTGWGLPCRATRTNRGVLLAITGIIAHKNQFRATSVRRESITP